MYLKLYVFTYYKEYAECFSLLQLNLVNRYSLRHSVPRVDQDSCYLTLVTDTYLQFVNIT